MSRGGGATRWSTTRDERVKYSTVLKVDPFIKIQLALCNYLEGLCGAHLGMHPADSRGNEPFELHRVDRRTSLVRKPPPPSDNHRAQTQKFNATEWNGKGVNGSKIRPFSEGHVRRRVLDSYWRVQKFVQGTSRGNESLEVHRVEDILLDYSQPATLKLIDSWINQPKAQGPSRTCNESKEDSPNLPPFLRGTHPPP